MGNIVVFTFPFQSHTNVALKIAKELVDRGEQVTVFAIQRYREQVKEIQAEFQDYSVPFPVDIDKVDANVSKYGDLIVQFSYQVLVKHVKHLKSREIDLIVHDYMASWGRFLGDILNKKAVSIMPSYILTPEIMNEHKHLMMKSTLMSMPYIGNVMKMQAIIKKIGSQFHIDPKFVGEVLVNRENLNIVTMSKELQGRSEYLDKTFRFVGNVNLGREEEIGDFPIERLKNQKVVYISLGTMFTSNMDLLRFCMKSLEDTEYLVVMSIGKGNSEEKLGKIPANVIVRNTVPQLAVLKHTNVYISHAGLNSVHEAIYYNVPMVLFPQAMEQEYIAARLKQLHCAKVLHNNIQNAEQLREIVKKMDRSVSVKEALKKISRNMDVDAIHKVGQLIVDYI